MWSPFVLWFLVGLAYATSNPGWKENAEYVFKVRGRTLTSLHEVSPQYSGILLKAVLRVQPRSNGRLQGQISDAEYSQIHTALWNGWNTFIPDVELGWKSLKMSSKPFQMEMKNGVITDLVVCKDIPTWEVNIIKSIVSQLQLNTGFKQQDESKNSAVFVTMEDTVTGNTETLYMINPLPDYLIQSEPYGQKLLEEKGDGEIIEVVKHKNYTNNVELPSYFFGFEGLENGWPATNKMGSFLVRESTSRAVLTGTLKRFTLQNSYTISEILVNPTLRDTQKGSVYSCMNITLAGVKSQNDMISDVPNPLRMGNLVYTYERHPFKEVKGREGYFNFLNGGRLNPKFLRNVRSKISNYLFEHEVESELYQSEESYKQEHPQLRDVPASPLLPYTTGYKGMSIRDAVDIVKSVSELAYEIGNDLQNTDKILHENTLNKFVTLSSLVRVMNFDEYQTVAEQLYTDSQEGPKSDAWKIYRDSVAECGTGPALLTIKSWIETRKIKDAEAALVLTVASRSVRQPTPEYVKIFFELVQCDEVQNQWPLNDTAILSFSEWVGKLHMRRSARMQYPVKSFVNFFTKESEKYINETVIPYFTQKLHEAISLGQTHKIHVYIRTLGNFAHPYIFSAFKPYLEGEKQASQYQRLLMVLSMDKLAENHPELARNVLFKIYQNPGETQEVRIAAVYQLMRTHPTTEMLQFMASHTNVDKHEHVNAAVKSAIEAAAEINGTEYYHFRLAALAAKPLLTKKAYGVQHGVYYLRKHFIEELNYQYKETAQLFGNEHDFYPKGLKYSLRKFIGEKNTKVIDIQAWVSNMDELIHVLKHQTEEYSKRQQQQSENYDQQKQYPWSSQKVANILKMKPYELEQLEGSLYMELTAPLGMLSFDNLTVQRIPEIIEKYEREMEHGKKLNFLKMINFNEMALSFPTDMGLPFLFTYDRPTLIKVHGSVKAVATPKISTDGKLRKPNKIEIRPDFTVSITSKVQSHISFITPFEHQQYIAGFDKHWQVQVPIRGNVEIDVANMKTKVEFELEESTQHKLFHYSTWPYTSRIDITNFQPVALQPNTHIIQQKNLHGFDKILGQKETGMAFRVQVQHKREGLNYFDLRDLLSEHGIEAAIEGWWNDASIQYSHINISYLPQESRTRKILLRYNYMNEYRSDVNRRRSQQHFTSDGSSQRLQDIIDSLCKEIRNVFSEAHDVEMELQGENTIKYGITAGYGKSNVDPKSRFLLYLRRNTDDQVVKPFVVVFSMENQIPNTNALDLHYTLRNEPIVKTSLKLSAGQDENDDSSLKITGMFEFRRSEERKQYLMETPEYQQCMYEMKQGNYQLPSCVDIIMEANLLDHVEGSLNFEQIRPEFMQLLKTFYSSMKYKYMLSLDVDMTEKSDKNELMFQAQFDPDLQSVNVSVVTSEETARIKSIPVTPYAKEIFVLHPVFHLRSRLISKMLELKAYRPFCVVDQHKVSTFNNRTYDAEISKYWTVMLQYIPKDARHDSSKLSIEKQMKHLPEHYVVLVRQNPNSQQQKDVKITVSSPETDFNVVDITMTPNDRSSKAAAKVTIDNQKIEFTESRAYDYKQGYIQVYALPNGEVKVEIKKGFYVIYDGKHVRLTVAEGKFRNSVRGICGQFNDEQVEDFLAPSNCIANDPYKFVKSYETEGQEGQQIRERLENYGPECARIEIPLYVEVISDYDLNVDDRNPSAKSTIMQTRYIEEDQEICFTHVPVPICPDKSRPLGTITKNVPVHCIPRSMSATWWKTVIDQGGSPDFSQKNTTKKVSMQLPQACSK